MNALIFEVIIVWVILIAGIASLLHTKSKNLKAMPPRLRVYFKGLLLIIFLTLVVLQARLTFMTWKSHLKNKELESMLKDTGFNTNSN